MFFKRFFQISITVLIVLMALATLAPLFNDQGQQSASRVWAWLMPSSFFQAPLFGFLWILIIIALVAVTVFSRHAPSGVRLLHLVLALTLTLIGYEKLTDQRYLLVLKQNQPVTLSFSQNPAASFKLQLLQFETRYHPGSTAVAQYQSKILANNRDTLFLGINKPLKLGPYRFFLNSYHEQPYFEIRTLQDTLYGTYGDSVRWQNAYLTILPSDSTNSLPLLSFQGRTYEPLANGKFIINNRLLTVTFIGNRYTNIVEVVHATKPKIIMLFGFFYLGCLVYVFWWKSRA